MILGLTVPEWIDVGVGLATLGLAIPTAFLAFKTSEQAKATVRLAELAQRQLEATTEPKLRVSRIENAQTLDIFFLNGLELLNFEIQNTGAGLAEIERTKLLLVEGGDDFDSPSLSAFGTWERGDDLADPLLRPGQSISVIFDLSANDRQAWSPGASLELRVYARALGSGQRYYLKTLVDHVLTDREQWRLASESFRPIDAQAF